MRESLNGPVLEVRDLVKDYITRDAKLKKRTARAVDHISFEVRARETFAIVGESGSGKSTIGRVILKLTDSTEGDVLLFGENTSTLSERDFRKHRQDLQIVCQDPS